MQLNCIDKILDFRYLIKEPVPERSRRVDFGFWILDTAWQLGRRPGFWICSRALRFMSEVDESKGLFLNKILITTAILNSLIWLNITAHATNFKKQEVLPFSNKDVKLTDSWIKEREELNAKFLLSLDPDRLLFNFRINAGIRSDVKPLDGWESPSCGLRGHFTGHFLSAASSWVEKTGDSALLKRINYMVDALAECQQKLGGKYLSAFPAVDFDTLEKKYGGVWAPYYTYHKIMQGLLDVYTLTGNAQAYKIVLNMADYVKSRMERLPETEIEKILFSAEANPTNEAGGMNEVLHNLYSVSRDPAHLKLASAFDREWFSRPLAEGTDILSGLHSNTHIVLINGYARRYENTGETYYHDAAIHFWDILVNHHCYVNGTSSGPRPIATTPTSRIAEHWGVADHLSATLTGEIAESCVTHNTQKLTANLFQWSASPEYANAYLNAFYNAVMPAQCAESGMSVYHLPLGSPRKKAFMKDNDFKCCSGTGIEAFTHLNSNIYFHDTDNIWVNLYIPSRVTWKNKSVTISQTGNFPENPRIEFQFSTKNPVKFKMNLLMPSGTNGQTMILVNGQPVNSVAKPNTFATIDRTWNNGDRIELTFGYDLYFKAMPDDKNVIAVYYGPVLLAFQTKKELILKGTKETILQDIIKVKDKYAFELKSMEVSYQLLPFYRISGESYGVYATIRNEY